MKFILLSITISIVYLFTYPQVNSSQSLNIEENDGGEMYRLVDSLSVKELLNLWNADSNPCQKKRSNYMVKKILDSIPIIGKNLAQVVSLFGKPMLINKAIRYDLEFKRDTNVIILSYHTEAFCIDGKPKIDANLNDCFFVIEFTPDSSRVKNYGTPCR
jgi:hypothetical protein